MPEQKPASPFVIHNDPVPLRVDEDGVIRVGDGRLDLATIVEADEEGLSVEGICEAYEVSPAIIHAVLAYYINHRDEVRPYLDHQAYKAFQLREQIEAEQSPFPTWTELQMRLDRNHAEAGQ